MLRENLKLVNIFLNSHLFYFLNIKSLAFSSFLSFLFRTTDGVNEVGEVKVSRLQMEGESNDKPPPEHKVEDFLLDFIFFSFTFET